ncbi:DUF6191 domain-containing protein [Actinokineospora terrae]|uniref:Uncharacterized protein n=1 Tax=Actinokineospora terrae TaxID=155974 RepID=A0A1H9L8W3_9PSEU|nr:DUF6191 domain-containing protein [Actinokineospora terrae]SER07922.1 hypothetical protein SAMN04487818_101511 [Actinokineospora terrae]
MSLPGVVVLLVVLAALERFGLWAHERSRLPWRRSRTGTPISAAGFDELGAAFSGAKRDEVEYRKTELMLRDDSDDGAPPRTTVDLDGFGVRVVLPPKP